MCRLGGKQTLGILGLSASLMPPLHALLAAHPLPKKPYNAIKFARFDGQGPRFTPSARARSNLALPPLSRLRSSSGVRIASTVRPGCDPSRFLSSARETTSDLEKMVGEASSQPGFPRGPCNRAKGGADLISFRAGRRVLNIWPR